jgi:hypothetical protein
MAAKRINGSTPMSMNRSVLLRFSGMLCGVVFLWLELFQPLLDIHTLMQNSDN